MPNGCENKRGYDVYAVYTHPSYFTKHSGIYPLIESVGAVPVLLPTSWERLQAKSWTLGHLLRTWGQRYYKSQWNALVPIIDELRIAKRIAANRKLVHYIFAEFLNPGMLKSGLRKTPTIGTYHVSARRQASVLPDPKHYLMHDRIVCVSESQRPFFETNGVSSECLDVIPLGVDVGYFCPEATFSEHEGPLQGLCVGYTERDHKFLAEVMRKVPPEVLELSVRTSRSEEQHYKGISNVKILPWVSDAELVKLYQHSDVVLMPMLDCTANDALLEGMACGTPVVVNRVGGIPEYVSEDSSWILDRKTIDEWCGCIQALSDNRENLWSKRGPVREWALRFRWENIAAQYEHVYRKAAELYPGLVL